MREGNNPEKNKEEKNILKPHRVLVVFYIPDSDEDFYREMDSVLDKCLQTLTQTINTETTNITLINNNSSARINAVIDKYIHLIDKHVIYNENKGKVYAVLNEVRGVFEPFVTITDADILFYNGWEKAVFETFKQFPLAGVVSPMPLPYLTFYFNHNIFGFNTLKGKIKYGKYVADEDIDLYLQGTNLPNLVERKTQYNWREKQLVLQNKDYTAVVGAYHVVSTYRTEQFRNCYSFPDLKFKNSYEEYFIDSLAEANGLMRLSTLKTHAYHIGNKIDSVVQHHDYAPKEKIEKSFFDGIVMKNKQSKIVIFIRALMGRFFIKFLWNR
ncbi:glycosyltransferase [Flavobacterium wongokense]|uniref:glycosyltransferase n=1 Tax=Flavobacterium wongokense TaxID=2910674 RepID=UPI001F35017C|nr:glycosyltransferase [Flavobacterium sp. WG47]MCF6132676.1 glycosyltransferase [Flavobacterium sp. WG47]